jgi:hypothetical protein
MVMSPPDATCRVFHAGRARQLTLEVQEADIERRHDADDLVIDLLHEAVVQLPRGGHHGFPNLDTMTDLDLVQQGGIGIKGVLRPDLGARQFTAAAQCLAGDIADPEIVVVDQIADDAVEQVMAQIKCCMRHGLADLPVSMARQAQELLGKFRNPRCGDGGKTEGFARTFNALADVLPVVTLERRIAMKLVTHADTSVTITLHAEDKGFLPAFQQMLDLLLHIIDAALMRDMALAPVR